MKSIYQEKEREKSIELLSQKSEIFYGAEGGGYFNKRYPEKKDVLKDCEKNLYQPIKDEVVEYFDKNNIDWWGGKRKPTGHILSSQIACLNHLFAIRKDKQAVLSLLKSVSDDFVDVDEIKTDKHNSAYIQFEAISDKDHLNEKQSIRGSQCTSIDALIFAKHKDGTKWLIPIEWKYTEWYQNEDKAGGAKGEERKERYTDLINNSNQLQSENHYCYYFEPFYQLMRQTLWAEQMIKNKETETLKADNYLHLHIIPKENHDLLKKTYKCSGLDMENTWLKNLKDNTKYRIVSPEKFLRNLDKEKYSDLINYLANRYWSPQKTSEEFVWQIIGKYGDVFAEVTTDFFERIVELAENEKYEEALQIGGDAIIIAHYSNLANSAKACLYGILSQVLLDNGEPEKANDLLSYAIKLNGEEDTSYMQLKTVIDEELKKKKIEEENNNEH